MIDIAKNHYWPIPIYRQYRIGICGADYNINPIISADIGVNIVEMQYCRCDRCCWYWY